MTKATPQELEALATQPEPEAVTDYSAWLIERNELTGPTYFQFKEDDDWTPDHDRAIHFSRRSDAEQIIAFYGWTEAKAVEHSWPAPSSPASTW